MGNKKTRITWLCILALLAGVFMGPLSLPVAAEETEKVEESAAVPLALNPGAADMRVGVMADSGFIRSNGTLCADLLHSTVVWGQPKF